jgi:hypothetical protein
MHWNKNIVFASLAVFLGSAVVFFLLQQKNKQTNTLTIEQQLPFSGMERIEQNSGNASAEETRQADFGDVFRPIIQQMEPIISYVAGEFAGTAVIKKQNNAPILDNPAERAGMGVSGSIMPIERPLTADDPFFSAIWPNFYLEYLKNMQQLLVNEGFYAEKRYEFTAENEIFSFLDDFLAFLIDKGVIAVADAERLQTGLHEDLPQSQDSELEAMSKQAKARSFFGELAALFSVNEAFAQLLPGGIIPGGDCYKDLSPNYPVPGVNLWAPCCDCELSGIPVGCLYGVCVGWPNAIWDQETGICGCG